MPGAPRPTTGPGAKHLTKQSTNNCFELESHPKRDQKLTWKFKWTIWKIFLSNHGSFQCGTFRTMCGLIFIFLTAWNKQMHPTTIESRQSECLSDFEVFIEKKRLRYQTIESRQSECLSGFVLVVVLIEKTFYVCSEKRANGKQGHFAPCFVGKRLQVICGGIHFIWILS